MTLLADIPSLVTRQTRHRLPKEAREDFWKQLPDSDTENHFGCGWVPTGRFCHACGKPLGPELPDPYVYQEDVILDDHLTKFASGGEQAGKSEGTAMDFTDSVVSFLGEYQSAAGGEVAWIVADSYELTRVEYENTSLWLSHLFPKIKVSKRVDPGEIIIDIPGSKKPFIIKTRSANDANTLRAESPVVVLVGEASLLSFDAYTRLISRVARARRQYPGYGAIIMGSTFEGSVGWLPTLWTKWRSPAVQEGDNVKSMSLPSGSNIFVYKGGMDDEVLLQLRRELPDAAYKERVLAVPSPPSGRVHQSFDPTIHVQNTKYDPDQPLYLGMDPGYSGASSSYAVEVVQRRYLDCSTDHWWVTHEIFKRQLIAEEVIDVATNREWWANPAKTAVIDIAGASHAGAMESNTELWYRKTGLVLLNQKVNIRPGIDRFETMLKTCHICHEPLLVFDPSCTGVISELGGGPNPFDGMVHVYSWHKDREGNVASRNPRDEYCDGIKALTYLFMQIRGPVGVNTENTNLGIQKRRRGRRG